MADILIVDDDRDVCTMLEQVLRLEHHTARVAHDGEAGMRLLRERTPEVVLLDVEMPHMDGPAMACRMLVEDCGLESIPIVLISGTVHRDEAIRRAGTPYYLAKPFTAAALIQLLNRALRERALPRPVG